MSNHPYRAGYAAGVAEQRKRQSVLLQAMAERALEAGVLLDPEDVLNALNPDRDHWEHARLLDEHGVDALTSIAEAPGVVRLAKAPVERDGIVEVELEDGETLRIRGTLFAPPF